MAEDIIGIMIIVVLAFCCKLVEDSKKISFTKKNGYTKKAIKAFYECFNIHISLSLGVIGLFWNFETGTKNLFYFIILLFLGIILKGVFSTHNPDRLVFKDRDALLGLYLPNACSFASVFLYLMFK